LRIDSLSNGIIYPSVRHAGGTCLVCVRDPTSFQNPRQGGIWRLEWLGSSTPSVTRQGRPRHCFSRGYRCIAYNARGYAPSVLIPLDVAHHSGMMSPGVTRPLLAPIRSRLSALRRGDLDAHGEACNAPCARCSRRIPSPRRAFCRKARCHCPLEAFTSGCRSRKRNASSPGRRPWAIAPLTDPDASGGGIRLSLGDPPIDTLTRTLSLLAGLFAPDQRSATQVSVSASSITANKRVSVDCATLKRRKPRACWDRPKALPARAPPLARGSGARYRSCRGHSADGTTGTCRLPGTIRGSIPIAVNYATVVPWHPPGDHATSRRGGDCRRPSASIAPVRPQAEDYRTAWRVGGLRA
jgi:hypothetical protein